MKNIFYLAAVLFGILLLVLPVSAETLTGSFEENIIKTVAYQIPTTYGGGYSYAFHEIYVPQIESTVGTIALVNQDLTGGMVSYGAGMSSKGQSIPVVIRLTNVNGVKICDATFGYQRNYNNLGVEIPGYRYIIFDPEYNDGIRGLTGVKVLWVDFDDADLGGTITGSKTDYGKVPIGGMGFKIFGNGAYDCYSGDISIQKDFRFRNTYNVTKPSGLGITGKIEKTINGVNYPSKAIIYDGSVKNQILSDINVVPDDLNFNVNANSIIIGVKNSLGTQFNTSVLFPTIINYNITVSPSSGKMTDPYTGTLNPTTGITAIRWYAIYPGQSSPSDFYDSTSTTSSQKNLNYALIGGNWMGWDTGTTGFTNNKGASLPNPVSLIPRYSGVITVGCYVYLTDGTLQAPTTTITVGENQALQKITFLGEDSLTGNLVSPSSFNIKKLSTNTWTNSSEVRPGQIDVQYPTGSALYVEVIPPTGSGYSPGTLTYQVLDTTGYTQQKVIQLWKGSSANVSSTTANLIVNKNSDFSPIKGASIVLSDGQSCITSAAGSCQMTLNNGTTTYYATVKATGYQTNQFYFLPTGASYSKAFQMVAIGATQTPYITVPPVVTGTGIPAGITTLNPTSRNQAVSNAGDIWFNGAVGLSALIFLVVLVNLVDKMIHRRKK